MSKQVANKQKTEVAVPSILDIEQEIIADDIVQPDGMSCLGGVFSLGEDEFSEFTAVIIDSAVVHSYFKTKYDPDVASPPACFAVALNRKDMAMVPVEESPEKQAPSCLQCKYNEFGTADNGKGKACQQKRRLLLVAVADPENVTPEDLLNNDVTTLPIPVTSVKFYKNYITSLAKHDKLSPIRAVTKFEIVKDKKTQHRIEFSRVGKVLDESFNEALQEIHTTNANDLVRVPDFTGYGEEEDTSEIDAKL